MPTLPPRNLPFSSPAASPHTPNAKGVNLRASPAPSTPETPSKKKERDASGILPRQEETTFHRKLRSLLWDHCKACERWEDVVSVQAAKSVASFSRLAASLDDLLVKRPFREDEQNLARILCLSKEETAIRLMDEMAILLKGLEAERLVLQESMNKIVKAASKLEGLSEAAEGLLVEATRAKGSDFTFDQELWVTWSMDRFVGTVQSITSRHLLQTEHLHLLSRLLVEKGCAPGHGEPASKGMKGDEEDEQEEESDEENEEVDDEGKERRKRRALTRERVMEEWQALALLKDEQTGIDSAWFEEICEVEVGRWEER